MLQEKVSLMYCVFLNENENRESGRDSLKFEILSEKVFKINSCGSVLVALICMTKINPLSAFPNANFSLFYFRSQAHLSLHVSNNFKF